MTVRWLVILKTISLSVRAMRAKSGHSCVRLCATPGTIGCQAPLSTSTLHQKLQVHGIGGSRGLVLNWALWPENKEITIFAFSLSSCLPLFFPFSFLFFFFKSHLFERWHGRSKKEQDVKPKALKSYMSSQFPAGWPLSRYWVSLKTWFSI